MDRVTEIHTDRKGMVNRYKMMSGKKMFVPLVKIGPTKMSVRRLIKGFNTKTKAMEYRDEVVRRCLKWQKLQKTSQN